MIDFHSHILPNIDDGSKSVDESIEMLELSKSMSVDTIVLTPHYYADRDSIETFLNRRDEAHSTLLQSIESNAEIPKIIMGAEVAFFSGMCREKELQRLCIGDTRCLLLEMPFCEWTSLTIREVRGVITNFGITPIIAHIERFIPLQKKNMHLDELLELGVVVQTNAEALIEKQQRRLVLKMIDNDIIHLLGSDCHNMSSRPPNMSYAASVIQKKLGTSVLDNIDRNGRRIIGC